MSREYIEKEIQKTRIVEILTTVSCDTCGKSMDIIDDDCICINVTTGHDSWGRDSVDSIEHHDLCSWNCLTEFIAKYAKENRKSSSYASIEIDSQALSLIK